MFFKPHFDLDTKQVIADLETKDIYVLDVRTRQEYQEGHIKNAHLIPVDELENRLHELPSERPIYIYCRSGQRANTAKRKLIEKGFREVYNFGGVVQWPYELVK